ncbi:DUF1517 domain-containing protein [Acaryochloris thomasi]|nr:DUF1517 domain-containing protein [Acaryochloris thomasi]
MNKKFSSILRIFSRGVFAALLIGTLVVSTADSALAARTGGRMGGGSFRRSVPSRSYRAPARRSPGGGYGGGYSRGYGRGGGLGFPFLIPFFGIGGGFGSLFSVLIVIAIANFLINSFRNIGGGGSDGYSSPQSVTNPPVTISQVQVGLLAEARGLQPELDRIAQSANTGSSAGLAKLLQETTLALLRNPEYWAYATAESDQTRLATAEAAFNNLALTERSKFQAETLSNVRSELQQKEQTDALVKSESNAPSEYIVVTLLVASQGKLTLPQLKSEADLRQALNKLGAVSSEELIALEALWTPQASGDTLTSDDLVSAYPDLKLL